jgi:5-methylthioadenosine/S-adenosylhomocysteine deaminase
MSNRTLIRNARVVSMDPELGVLDRADLLIEGDRIAAVAPDLPVEDAEPVDASNMIALPGMVDTHRHLWHTPFRGMDLGNVGYMITLMLGARRFYRPEDGYVATYAGALECLDGGVTTVVDFHDLVFADGHADEAVRGLTDARIRSIFCYGMVGLPSVARGADATPDDLIPTSDWHFDDARRLRAEALAADDALVTMGLATRELELLPFEATPREIGFGRELGVRPITTHAGMGALSQGVPWIQQLRDAGLLGPDLLLSHGQSFTDQELVWIAEAGASIAVSPEVEVAEGTGVVTSRALERGAAVSLGADSTYALAGDLFRQMQFAIGLGRADRARESQERGLSMIDLTPTPAEILEAATLGGARAVGLESRIGSLTPGKQADVVLLRADRVGLMPCPDPVLAVVMQMGGGDVDSVWVAGRRRKHNGRLEGVQLDSLRSSLDASREHFDKSLRGVDLDALRKVVEQLVATA